MKYVRVGDLDILNDTDEAEPQDFRVKLAVQHPEYDYSTLKHDIAILVLDKPVKVTDFVKPACLFSGGVIDEFGEVTATGWGITEFAGENISEKNMENLCIIREMLFLKLVESEMNPSAHRLIQVDQSIGNVAYCRITN